APINDIYVDDFNKDGYVDALLVGNDFTAETNYGRQDALTGIFLKGGSGAVFNVVQSSLSGFYVPGQSNHMAALVDKSGKRMIIALQNGEKASVFNINDKQRKNDY
ncbi:MAG: hypothetical protein AAFO99_05495, partial [Bacteroidota bacterium]